MSDARDTFGADRQACLRCEREMPELLYGSLAASTAREVRAHVAQCSRCQLEMRSLGGVLRALDQLTALEPAPASRALLMQRVRAARGLQLREWRTRVGYLQAMLLSVSGGALVAALSRLSQPLRGWLRMPWLDSMIAKQPWLGSCLLPITFWVAASVLVVMASPILVATRKRHMQSLASHLMASPMTSPGAV